MTLRTPATNAEGGRRSRSLAAYSDVLDVMLRPVAAYARLAQGPETTTLAMLQRPALLALLIGSCVALSASSRFTLRLLVSTTVLWSFAPLLQLVAAAVVIQLLGKRRVSLPAGLELYFLGIGPWSLWLLAVAGLYSFFPPERTVTWGSDLGISVVTTGALPLAWSALITFGFLRGALGLNLPRALLGLVLHAMLVWGPVGAWFLFTGHLLPRLAGLLAR